MDVMVAQVCTCVQIVNPKEIEFESKFDSASLFLEP